MTLPEHVKNTLIVVLTYACVVLIMRYRRDGTDWGPALVIGLLVTPLALLLSWGRGRLIGKAGRAGERAWARRRGDAAE